VYTSRMWGEETPVWIASNFFLFGYRDPGRNHVYQIWCRSVKGFLVGGVPNLPFPIEFDRRPYNSATLPRAL